MRIVAIANQKGGCGKTTTSINLGACLARLKRRVLLVDLDPQAHTTLGLGILPESVGHTLGDLLCPEGDEKPSWDQAALRINSYLTLLPGDLRLHRFDEVFSHHPQREKQLKYLLHFTIPRSESFDFALIDCPPNLGCLTLNALMAAQEVMIPIEPSFFSLHGLAKISETLTRVAQVRGRPLQIHALVTLFDRRNRFSEEVYEEVRRHFREKLFHTIIHESVSLREAASAGVSVTDFDPESSGSVDYMNLAREFLERSWEAWETSRGLGPEVLEKGVSGTRKVCGGILFQLYDPGAKEVLVAGDFNHWLGAPLVRRDGNGLWQRIVPLEEGNYHYKFLVDGEWRLDPRAPELRPNSFGTEDSVIQVGKDEETGPGLPAEKTMQKV